MKSSRSVRRLLLAVGLALGSAVHPAVAVTPQLAQVSIANNYGGTYPEDYILRADGSIWSLTSGNQVGTGFTALTSSTGDSSRGYALKGDGSLWSVNKGGALASLGSGYTALSGSLAIKSDGSLWNLDRKARVGTDAGYTAIWDVDTYLHFAGKADGSLWAWGSDSHGEFGDGSTTTTVASASTTPKQVGSGYVQLWSGGGSVFGLKSDGSLWAWGDNYYGQLGTGKPASCNPSNTLLNCVATATQIGSGFTQLSVGSDFALAVKGDGGLWDWGYNDAGQLGTGNGHYAYTPQQVGSGYASVQAAGGSNSSFGIMNDGTLWGWGINSMGLLGVGDTSSDYVSSPRQMGSGYASLLTSHGYNAAIKTDGSVWAWGMNVPRQTAGATTAPVQLLPAGGTGAASGGAATADCVFNWLEKSYPAYVPSGPATQAAAPYRYRVYGNQAILAYSTTDSHLYYRGPATGNAVADLGLLTAYQAGAGCN